MITGTQCDSGYWTDVGHGADEDEKACKRCHSECAECGGTDRDQCSVCDADNVDHNVLKLERDDADPDALKQVGECVPVHDKVAGEFINMFARL